MQLTTRAASDAAAVACYTIQKRGCASYSLFRARDGRGSNGRFYVLSMDVSIVLSIFSYFHY